MQTDPHPSILPVCPFLPYHNLIVRHFVQHVDSKVSAILGEGSIGITQRRDKLFIRLKKVLGSHLVVHILCQIGTRQDQDHWSQQNPFDGSVRFFHGSVSHNHLNILEIEVRSEEHTSE